MPKTDTCAAVEADAGTLDEKLLDAFENAIELVYDRVKHHIDTAASRDEIVAAYTFARKADDIAGVLMHGRHGESDYGLFHAPELLGGRLAESQ